MGGEQARVKVQMGTVEVEYEGPTSFLTADLIAFVQQVARIHSEHGRETEAKQGGVEATDRKQIGGTPRVDLSITTIASRLSSKTGPDLLIAAAAFLTLCQGRDSFSRDDLRETMKEAHGYFKTSMVRNLTKYLQGLLKKDRIRQTADGKYGLSIAEKKKLYASLTSNT